MSTVSGRIRSKFKNKAADRKRNRSKSNFRADEE